MHNGVCIIRNIIFSLKITFVNVFSIFEVFMPRFFFDWEVVLKIKIFEVTIIANGMSVLVNVEIVSAINPGIKVVLQE